MSTCVLVPGAFLSCAYLHFPPVTVVVERPTGSDVRPRNAAVRERGLLVHQQYRFHHLSADHLKWQRLQR
jgi:hypothetical protein